MSRRNANQSARDDLSLSRGRTPPLVQGRESRIDRDKEKSKRRRRRRYSSSSSDSSSGNNDSPPVRRKRSKYRRYHDRSPSSSNNSVLEKLVTAMNERNNSGTPGFSGLHGSQHVIPDFDPQSKTQTMKSWLAKVNESAHVYGWSERQTIFYSLPRLIGLAKRWYDGLTTIKYTWNEWQKKLLAAFPCEQNYGDLLAEMLSRKSRRNETLEEYYYDKLVLINRCEIIGKQAVDCISHGIYDHSIRMNVQGGSFQEPEDVLRYFRNISTRVSNDVPKKFVSNSRDTSHTTAPGSRVNDNQPKRSLSSITCFNCHEPGHIVSKCPKPLIKCKKCRQFGHLEPNCSSTANSSINNEYRKPTTNSNDSAANVLSITEGRNDSAKYYKQVTIQGKSMKAFVDLGSNCTLLREDLGQKLGVPIDQDNLPMLKGFGNGHVRPSGRVNVRVTLDSLDEDVEAYLVDPNLLGSDVLIGHSLTELPGVRIYKTDTTLFLYKEPPSESVKISVCSVGDNVISGVTTIKIKSASVASGLIYIESECCMKEGKEYVVLPGLYTLHEGVGSVLIIGLGSKQFTLPTGTTIARVSFLSGLIPDAPVQKSSSESMEVLRIISKETPINMEEIIVDDNLEMQVHEQLCSLLNLNRESFAFSLEELGKTSLAEMHIQLKDEIPVTYRPYRLSLSERDKVKSIVNEMLTNNIIRESTSEYASPIILVAKKNGDTRLCVDYRALNRKTVKEKFPMPLIDDQIDSLSGQVYFTSLDLASGYHQVPVSESSKHYTAFVTPDGHFEYNRMPFGLTNAPAVFQRLILNLLKRRNIPGVLAYMDDVIIASKTIPEGMQKLENVLALIKEANLTLNLSKCHFFKRNIDYLGFEISSEGVRPGQKKIEAVNSFKTPQNVHEVRQFVGLASFFRRFVAGFASIARPLTSLTKTNVPWAWGQEQDSAFRKLKQILVSRPVLAIYNPDHVTELHTDASASGLGGILLQRADEKKPLQAVAYFSRQTTADEQHFHSYELETLAVVASLTRFRVYLLGVEFKVVTDCNALRTTLTKRDLIPRIARWWLLVQEYTFTIEYRPGTQLAHADALSRNSISAPSSEIEPCGVMQIGEVNWLQSVQMSDPRLTHIKAILDAKCAEAKDVRDKYVLKDGKIFRKVDGELRWAVPKDARWKICQQCHDEAGHFALDKTLEKVRRDYWFPRITQFVKKYVSACIPCAYSKQAGGKKQGSLHPIPKPDVPFNSFHADHLGPFVKSKKGNTYILGIIDSFTKFIIIRAVRNTKSKTTISVLRDVFALFGTPQTLITDRGTSFTSNEFKAYIDEVGVKHVLNAVATPRANGQIERYNRSILSSLIALCHGDDDRNWDDKVPSVQWSLNNTINQGTGKSPTEIIFGRASVNTSENHLYEIGHSEPIADDVVDQIRAEASSSIEQQQNNMKTRYDKKRCKARVYSVGDLVMVQRNNKTPGESNKLVPPFSGPYKITGVYDHDRYEVSSVDGYSKKKYKNVYSVDKIKPWIRFTETDSEYEYDNSE